MSIRFFLDTDIGSDVDDALALALVLCSENVDLCGISTVYGPVEIRACIAKQLVAAYGQNIPIGIGIASPLSSQANVWTTGFEHENVLDLANEAKNNFYDGVELMKDKVLECPNSTTIVCIGPMTNIATLITKYPEVTKSIKQIIFMGGGLKKRDASDKTTDVGVHHIAKQYNVNPPNNYVTFYEHNIGADPDAAMIVLNSSIPKIMVGKHLTHCATFDKKMMLDSFQKTQPHILLKHYCQIWEKSWKRKNFLLHDPLTLQIAIEPTIATTRMDMALYVDRTGYIDGSGEMLSYGFSLSYPTPHSSISAVMSVDMNKFRQNFCEKVLRESFEGNKYF